MDIKCTRYPYLWGKKLMVEGSEIAFDETGVARGVSPRAANTLLHSGGYVDVTVVVPPPAAVSAKPAATASSRRAKQALAGS